MKRFSNFLCKLLVLCLLLTLTQAIGYGSIAGAAEEKKHVPLLRIGTLAKQEGFSIATSVGAFGRMNYNSFTRSNMLKVDEKGELHPDFFQSWELSDDGLSLKVTFPKDAKWHDGTTVTREDIEFSFDFFVNVLKRKNYKSLEIIDDTHGIIHFEQPASLFTLHSMTITAPIINKRVFEGQDFATFQSDETTMGCGPFKFVSYDADAQISYYEAFEEYFGEKTTIDKVQIRTFGGQEAMVMALANDEIDAIYDYSNPIDPVLMSLLEGNDAIDSGKAINNSTYFYNFFSTKAPMDDLAFRKAAVYALDYKLLGNIVNGELAQPASLGIISPPNRGFNDTLPSLEQDVSLAKDILSQAGYYDADGDGFVEDKEGKPFDLRITVQAGTRPEMYSRIAEVMMEDWAAVGIKSHFDTDAFSNRDIWSQRVSTPDYDVYVGVVSGTTTAFNTAFYYMLESSRLKAGVHPGKEMNELFQNMLNAKTEEEYAIYCKQLQQANAKDFAGAALCWDTAFFPYRTDKINGWIYYPSWGVINGRTWFSLYTK